MEREELESRLFLIIELATNVDQDLNKQDLLDLIEEIRCIGEEGLIAYDDLGPSDVGN